MNRWKNNRNKKIFLGVLLLLISLGYALLSSNVEINGFSKLNNSTWDIHFENLRVSQGSVVIKQGDSAASITNNNNTEVTYAITLDKPGDFYEFLVDAKNDGSIDGVVDLVSSHLQIGNGEAFEITNENLPSYLGYSVTYSDNTSIQNDDLLNAGESKTYKVRLEYRRDINSSDLPEEEVNLTYSFEVEYIQGVNQNDGRVPYQVIHRYEKLDEGYDTVVDNLRGEANTQVTPEIKSRTGFNNPSTQTVTISGEGDTTVTYTYTRKNYSFSITDRTYIDNSSTADGSYPYETQINVIANQRAGYTFKWSDDNTEYNRVITLTENTELTPIYTEGIDTPYKVVHKTQNIDGNGYTIREENTHSGTTGASITPEVKTYQGFTAPSTQTTTINGDGSTVVEYLYSRNKYTLTLTDSEYITTTTPTGNYYYETPITLTANQRNNYTFTNWSNNETSNPLTFALLDNTTIGPVYDKNTYTISLNPNNGSVDPTEVDVNKGSSVDSLPTPVYEGHYLDGWYTSLMDGIKITYPYTPEADITLFAKYKTSIASAVITNENISVEVGNSETINITNSAAIEEDYTFTSNNTSIATVDSTTGEVTGVAEGNTTITITGSSSNQTKTVNVTVTAPVVNKYNITLNANGGSVIPSSLEVTQGEKIGTIPTPSNGTDLFGGWYTALSGGVEIEEDYIPTGDMEIVALWFPSSTVAIMDQTGYAKLQTAINNVDTDGNLKNIKLLQNTTETLTVESGKNININLNGKTVNNTTAVLLTNNGTLEIRNGNLNDTSKNVIKSSSVMTVRDCYITCSAGSGAIDNDSGTMLIVDTTIEATGTRQAVYNNGGTMTIDGDTNLSSVATERATVHNLAGGELTILSANITSTNYAAVHVADGVVNIGSKDGNVITNNPVIQGKTYGVIAYTNYNFYDGIIMGQTGRVGICANSANNPTVTNDTNKTKIANIEDDCQYVESEEAISGTTYKTLYLEEENPKYHVSLNPNGGSVIPTQINVNQGSNIGDLLPTPTWDEWHTFDGWYTGISSGVEVTSSYVPVGDMEIVARWTEKPQYTITFDKNDSNATGVMNNQTIHKDAVVPITTNTYELVGYQFIGWNTKADGSGTSYLDEDDITLTKDITLYAQWVKTYTLTFDKNDNDAVGNSYTQTLVSGVSTPIDDNAFSAYTLSRKTLDSYNTLANNTGTSYYQGQSITITSDTTLYANWIVHQVDFETDSWEDIIEAILYGALTLTVGDTKEVDMGTFGIHTLRVANTSTPAECSTTGFSQTACGLVLEFADVITNHRMNPAYEDFTIGTGNVGGWLNSEMRTYVNSDIYNALPEGLKNAIIDTTVVSGHGNISGETNFVTTDKLYLLSPMELWGNNLFSQYDSARDLSRQMDYYANLGVNNNSYSGANKKYNGSDTYWWLRSANSNSAYSFNGVSYGSNDDYFANASFGVSPAFRITISPRYSVTFDKNANDAVGVMNNQNIYENVPTALNENTYTRSGYQFVGWNTEYDGNGTSYLDGSNITLTGNITLYAQWAKTYTLTFDKNDNDAVGNSYTQTMVSGVSTPIDENAFSAYTLTGKDLDSYNTLANNTGISYYQGQSITVSSDTTIYAQWVSNLLYNVLKNEATSGTLARKYTGSHGDSMDSSKSTRNIYHWYAENDTAGTQILDKNNVIFAGQCWQMIRTTDTGGVKMIYNGEAENNQCLSTRGKHVGYSSRTSQTLNSNYWYGTDYTYDKTNNVFSIAGTTEQATWNATTGPTLIGKYTCRQTTEAGTCATLYLVESYYNTTSGYVIPLNANSNYSQFGTLQFNVNTESPADVGYMYNTRYTYNSKTMTNTETMLTSSSLKTTYWYGDSVTWGTPTASRYNLDNPSQVSSTADFPNLVGKYTFTSTTQTYTGTSVYYIAGVSGSNMYYIKLTNSGNHTLADFNYTYTYGDSYRDNGNGTYTIINQDQSNPITINRSDWYASYSNIGAGKYVCKNAINDTCSELWYTTETTNTKMTYIKSTNNSKFAKSFEYKLDPDDNAYKYFLDDDTSTTFFEWNDANKVSSTNNAHYTCWNENGKCTTISYIYYINGTTPYYINIADGKSVDDAKNEMLYNNDVNQINSIMKSGVDAWYKKYILPYDSKVEDTIFCNDRSQSNQSNNGWNPNGGSTSTYMYFKESNGTSTSDLSCTNETDKFSISNNKARLTYKVGLMSLPEMNILNKRDARKTGQSYWLGSPDSFFSNGASGRYVESYGNLYYISVLYSGGVRPSVSLTPGTKYTSGDGSMSSPFIVN